MLGRFKASLSTAGELTGTLFFAASLSPSLLPRPYVMQGLISGFALAAGYGIGVTCRWLWSYLGLPLPRDRVQRITLWVATTVCLATAFLFLREASEWQNSIRELMELEPVDSARPFGVGAIAALVFVILLGIGRLFQLTFRLVSRRLGRRIPHRVASVLGMFVSVTIFWSVIDGVLFRFVLAVADASFQRVDALIEPDFEAPVASMKAGSAESLIAWDDLGRAGREFIASGPTASEIERFLEEPALEPIRVYVGLNAAETIHERVQLAIDELHRVRAFERSVLIVVTPTGTGWVDPAAMGPVEYLHRGDVASIAVQYSYLPSWLSLMVEPEYGLDTAAALFASIYSHWRMLPRDSRPALYLHGLSLGALNSQEAADLYDVIADPFAGALWSGPPFRSEAWREFTRQRDPSSPAWLPRFRDDSVVRFMNQHGTSSAPEAPWGPLRIVYLQYASDPITFFEPDVLYRSPEWLAEPRGPDVSPRLRWYPVVTMLQLVADLAVGDRSPAGYGHVYAPAHYIDAWIQVTRPQGWSEERITQLEGHLAGLK
ncbi:MAG: alpha/beta-hydrolase family protein [Gemmatimonadota bacterium]